MSKIENGKSPSVAAAEAPRRCHVIKVPDFDGYGFNLHAEKGKPGQYIGKVDDGSPAQLAGLRQGDRIIEVNGVNIGRETHKEVVQRIKAIANEVQLLVVDASVTVSKDNRIVDLPPPATTEAAAVAAAVAAEPEPVPVFVPPPPPRDTMVPSQTPDVVVQLPSSPKHSTASAAAVDVVDHAVTTAVVAVNDDLNDGVRKQQNGNNASPKHLHQPQQQQQQHPNEDIIVPITIKTDSIATHAVTTNATSTFSTSPKDHGHTNGVATSPPNTKFISTASFITSEQSDSAEINRTTSITNTTRPTSSTATTVSSSSGPPSPSATTVSTTSASSPPQSPAAATHNKTNSTSSTTNTNNNNNSAAHHNSHAVPVVVAPLVAPAAPKAVDAPASKTSSGLNLNMTVAELRAKLAAKKKFDPKSDAVDLRKKFEIVEKL